MIPHGAVVRIYINPSLSLPPPAESGKNLYFRFYGLCKCGFGLQGFLNVFILTSQPSRIIHVADLRAAHSPSPWLCVGDETEKKGRMMLARNRKTQLLGDWIYWECSSFGRAAIGNSNFGHER